jgi:hypothetical protein
MFNFENPFTAFRFTRGLSVRQLAQTAGISPGAIYRLVNPSKRGPHPRSIAKVLKVLAPDSEKKRIELAGEWLRWRESNLAGS